MPASRRSAHSSPTSRVRSSASRCGRTARPESFEELIEPDEANGGDPWLKTDQIPLDPWGEEYVLEPHPERRNRVLISSAGPDREMRTDDDITTDNMRSYKLPGADGK
jgi:hypothetical protein